MRHPLRHAKAAASPTDLPKDAFFFDERGLCLPGLPPLPHLQACERSHRLELLLAIAFGRQLTNPVLTNVVKAAEESRRGDQALANLRVALAGLSHVPASHDLPRRAALTDMLLAEGMKASDLADAFDPSPHRALTKFDPDQPRVPAGSGRESGQWTRDGEAAGGPSDVAAPLAIAASRATSLFAAELPEAFLTGLSSLAATLGAAAAVGGVLFVPWQKDVTSSGSLPGDSDHTYSYDSDEGLLQIRDASGDVVAAGHADKLGIFHDADTGVAFGRQLDGALVFDGAQMTSAEEAEDAEAAAATEAGTDDDPKLCPDAIPDNPGAVSASPRARAYQAQISQMINPQRPLPFGLAMGLINPETDALVRYDDCAEQTGTMIDAKGPGYGGLLSFPQGAKSVEDDFSTDALRQIQAAGSRQVEWYFAEPSAAGFAQKLFSRLDDGRENIVVIVQPPVSP